MLVMINWKLLYMMQLPTLMMVDPHLLTSLGLQPGEHCVSMCQLLDKTRINHSMYQEQEAIKKRRKLLRGRKKKKKDDKNLDKERTVYEPGGFV